MSNNSDRFLPVDGTGFLCGYYFPMDCVWADIDPKTTQIEQHGTRGTVGRIPVAGRSRDTPDSVPPQSPGRLVVCGSAAGR
jgi:hypothetical protein